MINILACVLKALQDEGLNVVAEIPENAVRPVMRLQENGIFTPTSHMPDWSSEYDLQADTWGETKAAALALVTSVVTELRKHPGNTHGQVTRFQMVGNDYQPDSDWPADGRPGPRYISILRIQAHPAP